MKRFSIHCCAIIALSLGVLLGLLVWEHARAQPPNQSTQARDLRQPQQDGQRPEFDNDLDRQLAHRVSLNQHELRLDEVIAGLRRQTGAAIRFRGLNQNVEGLGVGILVSAVIENQTLESTLDRLLPAYGMDWTIADGEIVISSRDQIWSQLVVRVYPIDQLLASGPSPMRGADPRAAIAEQIKRSVTPQDWRDVGGNASVVASGNTLIVKHTNRSHRTIKRTLAAMHATTGWSSIPLSMAQRQGGDTSRRERLFDRRIHLDLRNRPFREAVAALDNLSQLSIEIDIAALENEGLDANDPVTLRCDGVSLRAALGQLLFAFPDLDYINRPGGVLITTCEVSETKLAAKTYSVPELIGEDPDGAAADDLIELVTTVIDPISWEDVGGPASIRATRSGLVISQTAARHAELRDFFDRCLSLASGSAGGGASQGAVSISAHAGSSGRVAQLQSLLARPFNGPTTIKAPLEQFVELVGKQSGVVLLIDRRALDDVGIDSSSEVSVQASDVSTRSLLDIALRPLELTLVILDEMVWITTAEEAEANLITKLYPVRDLVTLDGRLPAKYSRLVSDQLIDLISTSLDPESWDVVGGPAAIAMFDKLKAVAISQTEEVHQHVENLLGKVRKARSFTRNWDGRGAATKYSVATTDAAILARIEKVLDATVNLQLDRQPLANVIAKLRAEHQTPIIIDSRALDDIGLDGTEKVTFSGKDISLRSALRHMLAQLDLAFTVRYESIVVTSVEETEASLETVIYPLPDLVLYDFGLPKPVDDGRDPELDRLLKPDFDTLITALQSVLDPFGWDQVGGWGTSEPLKLASALVVTQTCHNQEKVERLLSHMRDDFRQFRAAPVAYSQPVLVGTKQEKAIWKLANSPALELGAKTTTIESLAKQIAKSLDVMVTVDEWALEEQGAAANDSVMFSASATSLGEDLDRALAPLKLTWTIRDDALVITSPDRSENALLIVIYPLRHKLDPDRPDYDTLIESITSTHAPDSWDEVGGPGVIESWPISAAFLVAQTPQVHRQVAKQLKP